MKITQTIKNADGTVKTVTRDDGNDPVKMFKVKGEISAQRQQYGQQQSYMDQLRQKLGGAAKQGRGGDTQLAHVNPQEADMLMRRGGSGTINPNTGLREFANWYDTFSSGKAPTTSSSDPYSLLGQPQTYTENSTNTQTNTPNGSPMFDIPLNIMPTSTSQNQNASSSSSYSGLPSTYQNQLLQALIPQLTGAIGNMEGNIDQYTNQALSSYQQMMNNALKQNMPKAIGALANRGILNSTEGQGVMSRVMSDAANQASTKGYETAMQAALLKANMPTVLSQIGDLGKSSTMQSTGTGSGSSYSEDPTVMYRQLADMIMAMM